MSINNRLDTPFTVDLTNFVYCPHIKRIKQKLKQLHKRYTATHQDSLLQEGYAERVILLWNLFTHIVYLHHPIVHTFILREHLYPQGILIDPDNTHPRALQRISSTLSDICNLILGVKLRARFNAHQTSRVNIPHILRILQGQQNLLILVSRFFHNPPSAVLIQNNKFTLQHKEHLCNTLFPVYDTVDNIISGVPWLNFI